MKKTVLIMVSLFISGYAFASTPVTAGIFIGNNKGNYFEDPLFYADRDARKVMDVFLMPGNMDQNLSILITNGTLRDLTTGFNDLKARVALLKKAGPRAVQCIFYYSGHSGIDGLHINGRTLSFNALYQDIKAVKCDLNIIVLDSCNSGEMLNIKGIRFKKRQRVAISKAGPGEVIITSSAANEFSQERDAFRGSVFTYYFVNGLLGRADYNHDRDVSIFEAYHFAYINTMRQTFGGGAGMQHPSYRYKIRGVNDIILTRLAQKDVNVVVPAGKGNYTFLNIKSGIVFGDFQAGARPKEVVLPKGLYLVRYKRGGDRVFIAKVRVKDRRTDIGRLKFNRIWAKNDPIKGKRRRIRVNLGIRGGFQQAFGQFPTGSALSNRSYNAGLGLGISNLLFSHSILEFYFNFFDNRDTSGLFGSRIYLESQVYEIGVRTGIAFRPGRVIQIDTGAGAGLMVIRSTHESAFFTHTTIGTGFRGSVFARNGIYLKRFLRLVLPEIEAGVQVYKFGDGLRTVPFIGVFAGFIFDL